MLEPTRVTERHRDPEVDVGRGPRHGLGVAPERRREAIGVVEPEPRAAHHGREDLAVSGLVREGRFIGARRRRERRDEKDETRRASRIHPRSTRTFAFAPSSAS